MENTLLIPLLSVASSFLGVICGGLISNHSSASQMKAENRRLIYRDKQTVYANFLSAYKKYYALSVRILVVQPPYIQKDSLDVSDEFDAAYSVALLVAPESIREEISKLYSLVLDVAQSGNNPELDNQYRKVLDLLHQDLLKSIRLKDRI